MADIDFKTWKPMRVTTPSAVGEIDFKTWKPPQLITATTATTRTTTRVTTKTTKVATNSSPKKSSPKATTKKANPGADNKSIQSEKVGVMREQGREGETLRLTCPSTSGPGNFPKGTHFMWTSPEKLPLKMGDSGPRHTVQPNGGLIIQSLSRVDEGKYICSLVVGKEIIRNGTVLVTIEDCSMAPCLNGGECEDLDGKDGSKLFCRCLETYKGRYCETKKNLWLLLIPFVGSGVVVLALITVVARYTCFKKTNAAAAVPGALSKPSKLLKGPSNGELSGRRTLQPRRVSPPEQQTCLVPPYRPTPQLRTTPSGYLPRYDVQAQYGEPAYWPDRRFSYAKFQDGVVTQTGYPEDYDQVPLLPPGQQWQYAEQDTQTVPEFVQSDQLVAPPFGNPNGQDWNQQDSYGEYATNIPGSFHDLPVPKDHRTSRQPVQPPNGIWFAIGLALLFMVTLSISSTHLAWYDMKAKALLPSATVDDPFFGKSDVDPEELALANENDIIALKPRHQKDQRLLAR
ncbi:hypothetical protein BV898_05096 [Hypsibius exemplaris]|uniref:EGF-like domain-containing protein n=1 Tax=Hypsibius exemplaris TaxID=2072580 RepID=A0A1W0X0R7_HYPEX|nr:hypothetical protein BV898_05096 [Hypsibius exemplaris]